MGLEKLEQLLAKKIIAWTKTGESLLTTKPIEVNTIGLKYAPKLKGDVIQINKTIPKRAGTILNTKTGLQEPITFSDLPKEMKIDNFSCYNMSAYNSSKEHIGEVSFKLKEEPSCLYIQHFGTSGDYKGIGSEMIRKLVQLSDKLGMSGRIRLEACTGSIPFRFNGFADKCKTSAVIKYKKMGFNANRERINNKIMKEIAAEGNGIRTIKSTSGERTFDIFGATNMHLSEDAIKRYLEGV